MQTGKLRQSEVIAEQADRFNPGQTQKGRLHTCSLSVAVQPVCVSHSPASPQPQVPAFHVFSTHLPLPPPPRRLHPNAPLPPEVDLSPGSFHHGLPKQLSGRFMSTSFLSICYKSRIRSQKQNTVQCMRYSKPSRGGRSQPLLRYSLPHLPLLAPLSFHFCGSLVG